jgi:hypothetical protein
LKIVSCVFAWVQSWILILLPMPSM